ncbi:hypothetical protein PR001_g27405 [Phytophthora rubi]|uniref:Reverse transcriptase Ty1/copia-type domain-containing protein n=1 Tax=Phytophthora rubi TaxID=129364 RepID=A0A6A3HJ86_9STRA|nr:hypothetical protein PR001_g27405 [Phytophthora rubi]
MEEELVSLREHGTWKLVARAKAKRQAVITNRWVFVVKRDAQGRILRFKARLVINGFKQQFGVDYVETFAPVIRFETIRAVILYAVKRGWYVLQFDVKTVFLYGLLEECIFIGSPWGLRRTEVKIGFTRLDSDYGLYAMYDPDGDVQMLLTVYVDDLLLMGPPELCYKVATQLKSAFTLTSMGEVKYLLGIEINIDRTHDKIVYCQRAYIDKILKTFNMQDAYGCWTPQSTSESKANLKPLAPDTKLPYREIVGSLQYLVSGSRPDIAHAVRHRGKYLSCFEHKHFREAQRVLRYLKQTRDHGLHMDVVLGEKVEVTVYTDSDYANDPDDAKSISGYITYLDGNVISYGSRKQGINAQSSTEAEYIAMNEGVKDILWMDGLIEELRWPAATPLLRGDNQAALYLTAKPGKHSATKHIKNKFHLIRHLVEEGVLRTLHVSTDDNTADIMTKPLANAKFTKFLKQLKVLHIAAAAQTDEDEQEGTQVS